MSVLSSVGRAASLVTAVLALGLVAACGGGNGGPEAAASVDVQVMLGQALSAADVARIRVEVQGPGITSEVAMDLTRQGNTWSGTLGGIPTGAGRLFTATAYDAAATTLYQGQAGPMTVEPGRVSAVVIVLQQLNAPPPYDNEAPIIDSLTVSANEVEPGGAISLSAVAHDNNPSDTLTYAWSATGGTFTSATQPAVGWFAPATEGSQRIRLEVRDSKNATAVVSIDLNVRGAGGGNAPGRATVTVTVNTLPEVSGMMGAPSVLAVGTTTQLAVAASDADGDLLNYFWFSDCEGTFDDVIARSPVFTLQTAPATSRCAFTVHVVDARGGIQWGNLILQVGSGPQIHIQRNPVVDSVSQSGNQAFEGQLVTLGLTAHDPEGTALTFSWTVSHGTLMATRTSGGTSSVDWAAPACFDSAAEIIASVRDASGGETRVAFTVQPLGGPPCSERTVIGRRNTHSIQADGSVFVRPADLSTTYIAAWVPLEDGTFASSFGTGLPDGTFVVYDVARTPYYLQVGREFYWVHSRTPDLSLTTAGRTDLELEPAGSAFHFDVSGLSPWQANDDLQVLSFGAGITYFGLRQCASPAVAPVPGTTAITASTGYDASLTLCGNQPGRINLSRGDEVFVGQLVARPPVGGLGILKETRRGFFISRDNAGGSVVSGNNAVSLSGTLAPLATTTREVRLNASEFEAVLLAAHPRAELRTQELTVGALPAFMQYGGYAGWFDLAHGTVNTPGQALVAPVFEYADPLPASWTRFVANSASAVVSYSVPLSGGGNTTATTHRFTVYAHGPADETAVLRPELGSPRNLRINGQPATADGLQGVGTTPVVSWDAPLFGTASSYYVRVYRLSVGSGNTTRRTLFGTLITTDTQARIPPDLMLPGQHYYVQVQANRKVGGDATSPLFDAPRSYTSSAFTGRFQP